MKNAALLLTTMLLPLAALSHPGSSYYGVPYPLNQIIVPLNSPLGYASGDKITFTLGSTMTNGSATVTQYTTNDETVADAANCTGDNGSLTYTGLNLSARTYTVIPAGMKVFWTDRGLSPSNPADSGSTAMGYCQRFQIGSCDLYGIMTASSDTFLYPIANYAPGADCN